MSNPTNPFEELLKLMMRIDNVIYHIDIMATDRGIEIGARKEQENYDRLAPEGKEILDKVLNAMMEAAKVSLEKDGRCSGYETLIDKRETGAESIDDFFDRVKVIDDDG